MHLLPDQTVNNAMSATSTRIFDILIRTLPREANVGQTLIACFEDEKFANDVQNEDVGNFQNSINLSKDVA